MESKNKNTTLLIMDLQQGILSQLGDAASYITHVKKAIATARNKKIPVIFVVVGFRQGMPEISNNNKSFTSTKERLANADLNEFMKIHPDLTPLPEDVIVTKRRMSAFTGSDLQVILRSQKIDHIVLTGCSTSGVVLSTVREAADKDYRITILSDGCIDGDKEVHNILMNKVFLRQADVLTAEEWAGLA